MSDISQELIALLRYLMPGFIVAWMYYGLTSHPKPAQFERVIQALIFTVVVGMLVSLARAIFQFIAPSAWSPTADLVAPVLCAILLGFVIVYVVNKDHLHRAMRYFGVSNRSGHPSEWAAVLSEKIQYVVLHLKDGRRLYGWPKTWPSSPDKGHFFITLPTWIVDNVATDLPNTDGLLINVVDVEWVEFVTPPGVV